MKKVKALVPFCTGTLTMEQYEERTIDDSLASKLIEQKIVKEIEKDYILATYSGDMNVLAECDKTYDELNAARLSGKLMLAKRGQWLSFIQYDPSGKKFYSTFIANISGQFKQVNYAHASDNTYVVTLTSI